MNRVFKIILALILVLLISASAIGQKRELVDKIAAVVGEEIILVSELDFQLQMFLMQMENPNLNPAEADSLREIILQQMVTDKLLLVEAQKDTTLNIKEEQIEQALQQKIEELRSRFPSEEEFEAQMRLEGLNIRELKAKFRREVRNQLIRDRYVQRFMSDVTVTSAEVREFYEKYRDSLPSQPEAIKLAHILLNIEASGATLDSARMKAESS
jgi:peptidyl-prolyl cis-trans isomerase SurA